MKNEKFVALEKLDFALSVGIVVGIVVFLTTMFSVMNLLGGFSLMTLIYVDLYGGIGYSVTPTGALLGGLYSFLDVFILAYVFAWIYNKLVKN
jgi:hypothetical protein